MRILANKRRRMMTLGVVILLLVAVIVGVGTRILSSTKKPPTLSATTTPNAHKYPNFKGIFQFGSNSSTLASNPSIAGAHLGFYWSQLEPQQGQYNWSVNRSADGPLDKLWQEGDPARLYLRMDSLGTSLFTKRHSSVGL